MADGRSDLGDEAEGRLLRGGRSAQLGELRISRASDGALAPRGQVCFSGPPAERAESSSA